MCAAPHLPIFTRRGDISNGCYDDCSVIVIARSASEEAIRFARNDVCDRVSRQIFAARSAMSSNSTLVEASSRSIASVASATGQADVSITSSASVGGS